MPLESPVLLPEGREPLQEPQEAWQPGYPRPVLVTQPELREPPRWREQPELQEERPQPSPELPPEGELEPLGLPASAASRPPEA